MFVLNFFQFEEPTSASFIIYYSLAFFLQHSYPCTDLCCYL